MSGARLAGVGERAGHMSEELRAGEAVIEHSDVDRMEGICRTRRTGVDVACDSRLPSAALAFEKDRHFGASRETILVVKAFPNVSHARTSIVSRT